DLPVGPPSRAARGECFSGEQSATLCNQPGGRVVLAAPLHRVVPHHMKEDWQMANSDEERLAHEMAAHERPSQERPSHERASQERTAAQRPDHRSDQERWLRVKERLRAEVGEDIFTSWFARMDLEGIEADTVRLSVATRFLKTWIQSHYGEKVLLCWQGEASALRPMRIVGPP